MKAISLKWVFALLVLLALASILYFAEWVEVESPGGLSAEARQNPFLAASRFLETFGVATKEVPNLSLLDDLPSTDDTILLTGPTRNLSDRRQTALLDWVAGGGRLVLLAQDFYSDAREASGNVVLDTLGIELHRIEDDDDDEDVPATVGEVIEKVGENVFCRDDDRLTAVPLAGEPQDLNVSFTRDRYLWFADDLDYGFAQNAKGPQLVAADHGAGAVFVVTTVQQWRNRMIGCHDHAHLLRWIAEDRPQLWLLFNTEMPGILTIVWQRYPALVILCLALLFLWLLRATRPTVPVHVPAAGERRSALEHVRGIARFYFQQGRQTELIASLREACWQRAGDAGPSISVDGDPDRVLDHAPDRAPDRIWIESCAELIGERPEQVEWALTGVLKGDIGEFRRAVRVLQKILKRT